MNKSIVADAVGAVVAPEVVEVPWSDADVDLIEGSAELIQDADADQAKGLEQIKNVYVAKNKAGELTFAIWEDGRKRYEARWLLRAQNQKRDLVNPEKQANDSWHQTVVPMLKVYKLEKPKSGGADAVRKAEKRAKAEQEAKEIAAGRDLEQLREAQLAFYKTATQESIAQAKALDKAIEFVEKAADAEVNARLKVLKDAFRKVAAEVAKLNDEVALADAIVALKRYIKTAV